MLLWLKSSPAFQQIFAYDCHLAFAVMANITNMFLQALITDIVLTLIFYHLFYHHKQQSREAELWRATQPKERATSTYISLLDADCLLNTVVQ